MPRYQRQSGIFNVGEFSCNKIAIIGCGAIGSFVAVSLAKMGLTDFSLWDKDKVEEHNLPNQFFTEDDMGKLKVIATERHMKEFNSKVKAICECVPFVSRYILREQIVISCVDNMKSRKDIFNACKKSKKVQFFIDTRMAGYQGQVYMVDMEKKDDIKNYEKTLFSDKEAVQMRCTERAIIYTVLGIASMVCNQIVKAFREEEITNYIVLDYSVPQMM